MKSPFVPQAPAAAATADAASEKLAAMLREAGLRNGLDAAAAEELVSRSAVKINGFVIGASTLPREPGVVQADVLLVCPLPGLDVATVAQAVRILSLNLSLAGATGCYFGATPQGELQLIQPARFDDLDANSFADLLNGLALMAGAMVREGAEAREEQAA